MSPRTRVGITAALAVLLVIVAAFWIWPGRTPAPAGRPVVAVATLMTHPALQALDRGMRDELAARGYVEGKTVTFIERNANGQAQLAPVIAQELVARNPAVIVPITTPMAQAVVKVARGPVVFASVTDPLGARVVKTLSGDGQITGASDAWPYEAQLRLIGEISPKVRRIGVLYNPGEAASQHGIVEIRRLAHTMGYSLVEAAANSSAETGPAARTIVDRVDALFLSSDNTVITGMPGALKVAVEAHKPLFVGDSGTVEKGGLAAVSVGYYQHGRHTGELIARTLKGERNLPVVIEHGEEVSVNLEAARRMGVDIPQAVIKRATNVYRTIP